MSTNRKVIDLSILTIIKFFLVVIALFFIYVIKDVVAIIFVSLIFASAFEPLASRLEKRRVPRWASMAMIYIVMIAVIFFVVYLLLPPLISQIGQLAETFPEYSGKLNSALKSMQSFSAEHGMLADFNQGLADFKDDLTGLAQSVFGTIFAVFGGIVSFFLILVLTFYLTVEEGALKRALTFILPSHFQRFTLLLIGKVQSKIGSWFVGQLILCLIVGAISYVGLLILGVDYALALGLFAALGEFVPYVGPVFSAVPAIFIAFTQSPLKALLVLILYIIIQQSENHIIVPKVMQKAVGLNPIVSIIALMVGAQIAGLVGVLLSIPVATALSVIIKEVWGGPEGAAPEEGESQS
ncbi:MAG: AI-2E family transporter [Parcubacteria group bacterium]